MVFERAQAEYWIGFLARRRGDFSGAREWLTRYRDSALALVTIEGKKIRAQRELTSGHHNLAVLELDRGNLAAAQTGFLAEKIAVEEMLATNPDDLPLRFRLADVASWLGTVAERAGNYADAIERFSTMSSHLEDLISRDPTDARWRFRSAESMTFVGNVQALQGRRADASALYARSTPLLEALVAQDPQNQQWLISLLALHLQQVNLLLSDGNTSAAASLLAETRTKLEAQAAAEPSSRVFTGHLATAWRLESRVRLTAQRPDASDAVVRAISLGETLLKEARASTWTIWEFAQSCILAGRIASTQNQTEAAQRHWNRALEALAPRLPNSNEWRLLDPAAQAYVLLGKTDEARPLIEKLKRFGYRPIDPLAESILNPAPTVP